MLPRFLRSPRAQRSGGLSLLPSLAGLVLGVAAVVYLPLTALAVAVQPQRPPASSLPWLSARSGRIVDSQGRSVLLRGFNDDALLQVGASPANPPLTNADAALMQGGGFDVVRLPISWSLLEPRRGHFSQAYLGRIAQVVSLCAQHHLYVVLDMHTEDFGVAFGGSGAPDWLSVAGVPDLKLPGLSAAWQRHVSPAVNAALTYFWLEPNWQDLFWQAWSKVAAEFRGNSAVAGYDLYNEPHPLPVPPAIFETHLLWPFYANGIRKLALVDPNHLFIVEGDLFGEIDATADIYLLKWILHDWDDATCERIVKNVVSSMPASARLVAIEGNQDRNEVHPRFSMIDLQIVRPIPIPFSFVVLNG